MPRYAYDRLFAQRDGGIDVDTFKRATESFLHLVPRKTDAPAAPRANGNGTVAAK